MTFVTKNIYFRIIRYKPKHADMEFTTIAEAKKQTGLSYLGTINASAKMMKNKKVNHQYTYAIYLAPAMESGYNVCSHSTPECRLGCLATSGRAGMELMAGKCKTKNARIKKTRLFYEESEFFMAWLMAEIKMYQRKAAKDGYYFSVRLNATSDIDWQNVLINGKNIFEIFPDVAFYDYTKNPRKFFKKPANYHLTFSYTGRNWNVCEELLSMGYNIAMVFNAKHESELPVMYKEYHVINGDLTDYRIADGKGIIVGLKWKRIANREVEKDILQSCFVMNVQNWECTPAVALVEEMSQNLIEMKDIDRTKRLKKNWKLNNQDKVKLSNKKAGLKRFYGINVDEYNELFNQQNGKCKICGRHQSELKKSLSVDHNHLTGNIRGLLCNQCNLILGNANDKIIVLEKAIEYLKNS